MTSNTEIVTIDNDEKFLPMDHDEHMNDLSYARKNLYGAIEMAQRGLEELSEISQCSQHPRSYEVQHQFLKTLSELNKDLVQISREKKNAHEVGPIEQHGNITNNILVGSTKDIAAMIRAKKK